MEKKATRLAYGETLVALGEQNPHIVVLDADVSTSTTSYLFAQKFPERFFNVGIAEQDMIGIAAGLSLTGKIPFVCGFGVFVTGRVWDQLRISICYSNLNVKIGGTHGGITVGADGATHQALEEISLLQALPQMTIIVPVDALETVKAIKASLAIKGPVYFRLGREKVPIITSKESPFIIGKGEIFEDGKDITIIAIGLMVLEALKASKLLKNKGINAKVINLPTIKPIDEELIIQCARETGSILTVEEHTIMGGLGSAVAKVVAENYPVNMKIMGIDDKFGESGEAFELLQKFGLTSNHIAEEAQKLLMKKK